MQRRDLLRLQAASVPTKDLARVTVVQFICLDGEGYTLHTASMLSVEETASLLLDAALRYSTADHTTDVSAPSWMPVDEQEESPDADPDRSDPV